MEKETNLPLLEAYRDMTLCQIELAGEPIPEALLRNLGEVTLLLAEDKDV